jgi:selenocysteine lyase/cysteine desulfurase
MRLILALLSAFSDVTMRRDMMIGRLAMEQIALRAGHHCEDPRLSISLGILR